MLLFSVLLIISATTITSSHSARILGIIATPSYSHQVVFHPLWTELSLRGHQVTVITTHPINNQSLTNLTEIDLHEESYELWREIFVHQWQQQGLTSMLTNGLELLNKLSRKQFGHPEVQKLIKDENQHFDLLLVEHMFPVMFAFAERFKCPFILLSSMEPLSYVYQSIGNPAHPVLNPDLLLPFLTPLTFLQRLASVMLSFFMQLFISLFMSSTQQQLVEEYFGPGYPPLEDIFRNASMLFVNSDPLFSTIRPLLPSVVLIGGGSHLKPPKPLPSELQRKLDNAPQGFIYFSLGSNFESTDLTESVRSIILETFAELPCLVLWKFELEELPAKPDNVIISKWFPQQDVLRHPNIKLFITQGGLQSTEESIYSHVPMVGLPLQGDQYVNAARVVQKGMGLTVDYSTLSKKVFKETILEVINDQRYRKKVEEFANLARDQPNTGLERAVWWTEYVLRHKGAPHFRSPALDIPTYQYYLLDVIGFCVLVIAIGAFIIVKLVKLFIHLVQRIFLRTSQKPKRE